MLRISLLRRRRGGDHVAADDDEGHLHREGDQAPEAIAECDSLTASGDAPLAMAPIETTTTAMATKIKASGNQRSAHAVKAMATRTKAPSGFVGPPDARPGAAAVVVVIASPPKFAATLKADDLAGIHDVQRIERPLDGAHGRKRRLAVLGRHILHLALADAVLAGAGAVHR